MSLIVEKFNNIDWTTNNGECPMDKLKLTKNPNNKEHRFEYKRKDREVDGEPVVFIIILSIIGYKYYLQI